MEKEFEYVESTSSGQILRKKTQSTRIPYEHQIKAMQCLDKINESPSFATMVVLPTGGGKNLHGFRMAVKKRYRQKEKKFYGLRTVRCF